MADEATLWTEEKLTKLIEKIILRALDEQQKNLFYIISGDFEISKQQIAELKKENVTENVFYKRSDRKI